MDINNETCVQRARFFFSFFEKRVWKSGEEPPLGRIIKVKDVQPEAIRNLSGFLTIRLNRIASMMEVLLTAHSDWAITGRKDSILMETESFDFNEAVKVLQQSGFTDEEFVLNVEYTRKWGVL